MTTTEPGPPPHFALVALLDCPEDRLLHDRYATMIEHGGGFQITMAGGGAALFTDRDGKSCMGQFLDLYGVHPYEQAVIRVHKHCGKLAGLVQPDNELEGLDPDDDASLYELADHAAELVHDALMGKYGIDVPVSVQVVDIVRAPDSGEPTGKLVPRPQGSVTAD